jgi:hypothetical protein
MTGQISDGFRYQEHEFAISGISDHKTWFKPSRMRLKPDSPTTACWRGYVAHFALANAQLVLDQLHICLVGKDYAPRTGPIINGVKPKGPSADRDWFNNHYLDLGYPLKYTGRLLLGTGFIQALYVHMGDQLPWKYENVHELVFKDGLLIEAYDRSDQMVAIRQRNIQIEAENDDPGRVHRWPDFTIGG